MPPADYINTVEIDGVTVVSVQVESLMGMQDVNMLAGELDSLLAGGLKKLVIDLQRVRFCGSAALGVLMSTWRRMNTSGGTLILANTQNLDQLLKVVRGQAIFKTAPSLKEAVRMLQPR
jgi:anti-anti-sigma factor